VNLTTPVYNLPQLANTTGERGDINLAIRELESLLTTVDTANVNINTPPGTIPAVGTMLLIGDTPTGVFSGFAGHIAIVTTTGYTFIATNALTGFFATTTGFFKPNATFDGWEPLVIQAGLVINRETISATKTLTIADAKQQVLGATGGTQQVELPASGSYEFCLRIIQTSTDDIELTDGGPGVLVTLSTGIGNVSRVDILSDGTDIFIDQYNLV
jgi:hypothetical protein